MPSKNVLVIGDWFFDEYWIIASKESYHSSHAGTAHYKIYPNTHHVSFCGAPEVLKLLSNDAALRDADGGNLDFYGCGTWHPMDDDAVNCLVCNSFDNGSKYLSHNKLISIPEGPCSIDECTNSNKRNRITKLFNLVHCDPGPDSNTDSQKFTTNRIIRCFRGDIEDTAKVDYRVDWAATAGDDATKDMESLKEHHYDYVVIEDHGYGVMSPQIIDALFSNGCTTRETRWFIRTKVDFPEWLIHLSKRLEDSGRERIALIALDFHLAEYQKGGRNWWIGSYLSRAALELLCEYSGAAYEDERFKPAHRILASEVAVLLDDNNGFGLSGSDCVMMNSKSRDHQKINIGRTTVFFASLVRDSMMAGMAPFQARLNNALENAHRWTKTLSENWGKKELEDSLNRYGMQDIGVASIVGPGQECAANGVTGLDSTCHDIISEWRSWNQSQSSIGTISHPDVCGLDDGWASNVSREKAFQSWRSYGTLGQYVCISGEKRDGINNMLTKIANYIKKKEPRHSLSCLLTATPGWGKSSLARSIATYFNLEYLEYSVAQFASTRDFIDCMSTILSVQNRTGRRTLCFIDEINAKVGGHEIMGLLLSPLWDSSFIMDGKMFALRPGVWMFASTDDVSHLATLPKGADFVSRLNGPILELDTLSYGAKTKIEIRNLRSHMMNKHCITYRDYDTLCDSWIYRSYLRRPYPIKTEQVYFALMMLQKCFGPIKYVYDDVMHLFHDLYPINGYRSMEIFVESFVDIQDQEVTSLNVPRMDKYPELWNQVVLPTSWVEKDKRKAEHDDELKTQTKYFIGWDDKRTKA